MTKYKQIFTKFNEDGEIVDVHITYLDQDEFKITFEVDNKHAKETTDKVRLSYYYENKQFVGYAMTDYKLGINRLITKE